MGLSKEYLPCDLTVDLGSDSQQFSSNLLKLLRCGRIGLNQLKEDTHDVHTNKGQELLLVHSLSGTDVDGAIGLPKEIHKGKFIISCLMIYCAFNVINSNYFQK